MKNRNKQLQNKLAYIFVALLICMAALVPQTYLSGAIVCAADDSIPTVTNTVLDDVYISSPGHQYTYNDLVATGNNKYTLYVNTTITVTRKSTNIYQMSFSVNNNTTYYETHFTIKYNGKTSGTLTSQSSSGPHTLVITQVPNNFYSTQIFEYKYGSQTIAAPSYNVKYNKLTMVPLAGAATEYYPITIKMNFNGDNYTIIYNGNFYYVDTNNANQIMNGVNELIFNKSGHYILEIYDITYSNKNFETSQYYYNYLKYEFVINTGINTRTTFESGMSDFYMTLQTDSGDYLMTGSYQDANNKTVTAYEYTNHSLNLEFHNISSIARYGNYGSSSRNFLKHVVISKSVDDASGHYNQETTYTPSQLASINFKLTFDSDGQYTIRVVDTSNKTITVYTTSFFILKNIRNSGFKIDNITYTSEETNVIDNKEIPKTNTSKYSFATNTEAVVDVYGLKSTKTTLQVVNPSTSITGISNNASTTDEVSLKVSGVGEIIVTTTINGNTTVTKVANGDTLTYSQAGSYYVKIVDQMGNVVTRSFKINVKMNGAAITLIVVGAATLAFLLLFIFKTRKKVSVR